MVIRQFCEELIPVMCILIWLLHKKLSKNISIMQNYDNFNFAGKKPSLG
jgi:hypothetical protein